MEHIQMKNDNLMVVELTDDLYVDGLAVSYDCDSPYMFCKVVNAHYESGYSVGDILVIKRYAKEEFLPGYYFISTKDVRCLYNEDAYEKLLETK